jgi:transposase
MSFNVAAIDVHKKVLMVVVASSADADGPCQLRRFGATTAELRHLAAWLQQQQVREVVMESTAQYWKPVWMELEAHFELRLAQAQSNRAPHGRKWDFADAQRLLRRLVAGELCLSFVPGPEQRGWRTLLRTRVHLAQDRVRLHNQIESLLEEARIKLSSVISDLLSVSGRRILHALAHGMTDPAELAALGNPRLHASREQLIEALSGACDPVQQQLLRLYLERVEMLDRHRQQLEHSAGQHMRAHQSALSRLARIPGLGLDSAQQILAEVGPSAETFPSPAQLASWVGVCPGRHESAERNQSGRCAKGNRYLRRLLCQAAQAAVKTKGSYLQTLFRRLLIRLGYAKAIWAIAHRLCRLIWLVLHRGVDFIEHGQLLNPQAQQRRVNKLVLSLRRLGYSVQLTPNPAM